MLYQSVIIPTCNHPDLLKRCLVELLHTNTSRYKWEILIMDNSEEAFQPQNAEVVRSFSDPRIRHIEMAPLAGLMAARHLGAEMARGEILSFIDDDSFVERTWVQGVQGAFKHSDCSIVTGSNLPDYEEPPPSWLDYFWYKIEYGRVCYILSLIDFGRTEKIIQPGFAFGCNISIKKELFWRVGGSNPDYLPPAQRQYQGDGESALSVRVAAHGGKTLYRPECNIKHYVPSSRLTKEYFGNRAFFVGVHSSFTQIRREHGLGPYEGVPSAVPVKRSLVCRVLGKARRMVSQLWLVREHVEVPEEVQTRRLHYEERYQEGWMYHRSAVDNDPSLLEYVLRKNYLGNNALIPGK